MASMSSFNNYNNNSFKNINNNRIKTHSIILLLIFLLISTCDTALENHQFNYNQHNQYGVGGRTTTTPSTVHSFDRRREAISTQQQQQQQSMQQHLQHRKYYHHFRFSELTKSPAPQLSGIDGVPWPPNLSVQQFKQQLQKEDNREQQKDLSSSIVDQEITIVANEIDFDNVQQGSTKTTNKQNNNNKIRRVKTTSTTVNNNPNSSSSKRKEKKGQKETTATAASSSSSTSSLPSPIDIFPLELEFKRSQLCIDRNDSFEITNNNDYSVQILSIQTDSQHFETDFIRSFMLKGNEKHKVKVVFKPRWIGEFETVVQVHSVDEETTQAHVASIQVKGWTSKNYYQLESIKERVLMDTFYTHPISIYNPNNQSLYIQDIYTSGVPFYLSLPASFSASAKECNHQINSYLPISSVSLQYNNNKQFPSIPTTMSIWEIPPYTKKHIINLYFKSSLTGVFNGVVHIDTNYVNFAVNAEIESVGESISLSPQVIDFGFITGDNDFKSQSLFIYNYDRTDLTIIEVRPLELDSRLKFFVHDDEIPISKYPIEIIHFFYIGDIEGEFNGTILIKFSGHKDIEVPYKVTVNFGDLSYHPKDVLFPLVGIDSSVLSDNDEVNIDRYEPGQVFPRRINEMTLRNNFNMSLTINSVYVNDNLFVVKNAPIGATASQNQNWPPITLELNQNYKPIDRNILISGGRHASLYIDTNVTTFEIDMHAYNRLISISTNLMDYQTQPFTTLSERMIDFGIVSKGEKRKKTFKLKNTNPFSLYITCVTPIKVQHQNPMCNKYEELSASLAMQLLNIYNDKGQFVQSGLDSLGADHDLFNYPCMDLSKVMRERRTTLKHPHHRARVSFEPIVALRPGHTATFSVDLLTNLSKGYGERYFVLVTQYENVTLSYRYRAMEGTLNILPSSPNFGTNMVMSRPILRELNVVSTYSVPINITSIDVSDPRTSIHIHTTTIAPNSNTHFATVEFTPLELVESDDDEKSVLFHEHIQMFATSTNGKPSPLLIEEFIRRNATWGARDGKLDVVANINVHTDILSQHTIRATSIVTRPALLLSQQVTESEEEGDDELVIRHHEKIARRVEDLVIDFGMVRIKSDAYRTIDIYNPLDVPVVAQLLDIDILASNQTANQNDPYSIESGNGGVSGGANNRYHHHHKSDSVIDMMVGIFSLQRNGSMYIAPRSTVSFGPIRFHPTNYSDYNATMYLKNNFTLFQVVHINGQGGGGRLMVRDQLDQNSSTSSILLELNKTHLAPCILSRGGSEDVDLNSDILSDKSQKKSDHVHHQHHHHQSQNDKIEMTKSFTIINKGNLILDIKDIFINDLKCSGYGFKVLNCNELKGLSLKDGEMTKIQISYEPNFSTSLLKKELVIKTNQEMFSFTLIGSIPHEYLSLCTHLQPSFFYEYPAKIVFIISMIFLFFVLIFLTFREYSKPIGYKGMPMLQRLSFRRLLGGGNSPTLPSTNSKEMVSDPNIISEITNLIPKSPDKSTTSTNHNKKKDRKIKSSQEEKKSKNNNSSSNNSQPIQQRPVQIVNNNNNSNGSSLAVIAEDSSPLNRSLDDDISISSHAGDDHSQVEEGDVATISTSPSPSSSPIISYDDSGIGSPPSNNITPIPTSNITPLDLSKPTQTAPTTVIVEPLPQPIVHQSTVPVVTPTPKLNINTNVVLKKDQPPPTTPFVPQVNVSLTPSTTNHLNIINDSSKLQQQQKKKNNYQKKTINLSLDGDQSSSSIITEEPKIKNQMSVSDNAIPTNQNHHSYDHSGPSSSSSSSSAIPSSSLHPKKKRDNTTNSTPVPKPPKKKFEKVSKPTKVYVVKGSNNTTTNSTTNNVGHQTTHQTNNTPINNSQQQHYNTQHNNTPINFTNQQNNDNNTNNIPTTAYYQLLQQQQQSILNNSPFTNHGSGLTNPFDFKTYQYQSNSAPSATTPTNSNPTSPLNSFSPFSYGANSPSSQQWFTNNNLMAMDSNLKSTSPSHNSSLWKDQFGVIGSGKVNNSPNHYTNNMVSSSPSPSSLTATYRDHHPFLTPPTSPLAQNQQQNKNNSNNNNNNNNSTTNSTTSPLQNLYTPSYDLFANQFFFNQNNNQQQNNNNNNTNNSGMNF